VVSKSPSLWDISRPECINVTDKGSPGSAMKTIIPIVFALLPLMAMVGAWMTVR